MKKFFLITTALMTIIIITACGDTNNDDTENKEPEDITIGISMPQADHSWMGEFVDNAEKKSKEIEEEEGIEFILTNADDPNKQANDVQDLLSQDVDVIVLEPIESEALTPVGDNVADADVPLVTVDRELESDVATAVVKGDNEGIGENAGKFFLEEYEDEDDVKVVEIEGSPTSVTKQRGGGFKNAIEDSDNINIISTQDGDFTKNKALDVTQDVLQSESEIDAIFTQDDEMAEGVMQAIEESGRDDIDFITGAGGSKAVLENIKEEGMMKATFLYPPTMIEDGIDVAIDIAKGNEIEDDYITKEATEVTKDNVEEYYDPDSKY